MDHKNTLIQILEMQKHDQKVIRIAPTFTRLENDWSWPRQDIGFSNERWSKYCDLFEKAGITDGIQEDGDYVFYFVSSRGLAIGGTSRGFVYVEHPREHPARALDQCPSGDGLCLVAIESNWYLFEWTT